MKNVRPSILIFLGLISLSAVQIARAQAPVVDLSQTSHQDNVGQGLAVDREVNSYGNTDRRDESVDQRVQRLERQIANLTEMNFASKVEKLQQDLQSIRGAMEVQTHELNHVKEQLRNFYQDLDQRLGKLQPDDKPVANSKNSVSAANETSVSQKDQGDTDKNDELQAYESAFNLLNKKDYDKAIEGFQGFVKDYPTSSYTGNAHYWLGEIFYLRGNSEKANKEFQAIISNYPENPKVPDAMLKVALIAMDGGDYAKAKQNLLKIQKQFPGTTAAKVATLRLKEIKQKR